MRKITKYSIDFFDQEYRQALNFDYNDYYNPPGTLSYKNNLEAIKPDYVVHADDWQHGPQAQTRKEVLDTISNWNGVLIEVPYTQGISSTKLREHYEANL